jgi:hypothetical protein
MLDRSHADTDGTTTWAVMEKPMLSCSAKRNERTASLLVRPRPVVTVAWPETIFPMKVIDGTDQHFVAPYSSAKCD